MTRQSDYIAAVLADAPVAYYVCNEGSGLLQDSSGNGHHTTSTRTGTTPSVIYGSAGPADGSTRAIASTNTTFVVPSPVTTATNNWTLECWVGNNTADGGATPPLGLIGVGANLSAGTPGGGSNGYSIGIYNGSTFSLANGLGVDFTGGGGTPGSGSDPSNGATLAAFTAARAVRAGTAPVLSSITFSHILVIRRAGVLEYWVDGQMETPVYGSTFAPGTPTVETRIFKGNHVGFNVTEYMCHAAIYDHALSSTRIAAHRSIMTAPPLAEYDFLSLVHVAAVQQPAEGRVTIL